MPTIQVKKDWTSLKQLYPEMTTGTYFLQKDCLSDIFFRVGDLTPIDDNQKDGYLQNGYKGLRLEYTGNGSDLYLKASGYDLAQNNVVVSTI